MKHSDDVTLQINLSPSDWRYAQFILPHQIMKWKGHVGEVLLILDLHRSSGKFSENWELGFSKIYDIIKSVEALHPSINLVEVDYSESTVLKVGKHFFNKSWIPPKDFRGGPFYSYFFGLFSAQNRYILHLDSDMMFGGNCDQWLLQAIELLKSNPELLTCSPLPGPPSLDGQLKSQNARRYSKLPFQSFQFDSFSTRIFFIDILKLRSKIGYLNLQYTSFRGIVKAIVEGNYPFALPEAIITDALQKNKCFRLDFLGEGTGAWSLHPPYRSENFYRELPAIIDRIDRNDIPEQQSGDHDVNSSLVDWSDAKARLRSNRWWNRLGSRLYSRFSSL
ncbi:MAG: hypothetical protein H7Y37_00100 [Anaerolineae bacterium]|nr:hypothetical protein [Gloeobacterales cyanobacterium ES-bin-313]